MPSADATASGQGRRWNSPKAFCGAKKRRRKPGDEICRMPSGWGTEHVGIGAWRKHGGNMESHRKRAARIAAVQYAKAMLGDEVALDPIEALLQAVRLAAGATAWHRNRIRNMEHPSRSDEQALEAAIANQARIAGTAVQAGVAERLMRIVEREAEEVVAVCFAGQAAMIAAGAKLTIEQRTAFANGVAAAVEEREGEPEGIIDATVVELPAATSQPPAH